MANIRNYLSVAGAKADYKVDWKEDAKKDWKFDFGSGTPALVNTVAPAITGTVKSGNSLSLSNGTWTGSPDAYAYTWYADGVVIAGATSNSLSLTGAHVGKKIKALVTATKTGAATQYAFSNETVEVAA